MGTGMANLVLDFASNTGIADLLMDVTFRHLIDCLDEGQMSEVGVMVIQTICAHGEVHIHTVRFLLHSNTVWMFLP